MKKLISIVFIYIVSVSNSFAVPSGASLYLMNEKASLFDFGIYKVREKLKETKGDSFEKNSEGWRLVDYDWSENKIIINRVVYPKFNIIKYDNGKNLCRRILTEIKISLGANVPEGYPRSNNIATYFYHDGYQGGSESLSLFHEINAMTLVKVGIVYSKNDDSKKYKYKTECTAEFIGHDVEFKELEF